MRGTERSGGGVGLLVGRWQGVWLRMLIVVVGISILQRPTEYDVLDGGRAAAAADAGREWSE